jgi:hypothetical protein
MTELQDQRPSSRYGRQRMAAGSRRRVAFALGVLVVAVSVIIAVLAYQRFSRVDVKGDINAYQVLDDQTVSVTISVTRTDPSKPASCIVRARSKDGDETGRREILVPPSTEATIQVATTVKSYKPPFVGDIYGCGIDVPGYLTSP